MDAILNYEKGNEDDYYEVIGCDELSSIDQILCEYKVQSVKWHPDKNPDNPEAVEKFQKLQKAKEILCDPEKRALYDKWRKCGIAMSFESFLNINKVGHTSIHWVSKKKKDLMLELPNSSETSAGCVDADACCCPQLLQGRDSASEMLRKFRTYGDAENEVLRRFRNYEL